MLRVNYDMSLLGDVYGGSVPRTGIARLTENLLFHLLDRADLKLSLSAPLFRSIPGNTEKIFPSDLLLDAKGGTISNSDRLKIFFDRLEPRFAQFGPPSLQRIYMKFHLAMQSRIFHSLPLNNKTLSRVDIYHAPFFPMPHLFGKVKIKKIATCCDILPVTHPEFFVPSAQSADDVGDRCDNQEIRNDDLIGSALGLGAIRAYYFRCS